MLREICRKFDFPEDSIPVLEEAYVTITKNARASAEFSRAVESLIHPNEITFNETTAKIADLTSVHPYTLNAVLCALCSDMLRGDYKQAGLSASFDEQVGLIRSRLINCKEKMGVFGIIDGFWQWIFHELQCVTLGRLEYEPFHHFCDLPYKGIVKGDPIILIHIPRGKSLDMDEVMESLRMGYEHFKDRFAGGIVPFMTHSWLLYPPFLDRVFKRGGNIERFASIFDIIAENTTNNANFPNVFGCPYPGEDLSGVPQNTSLQRSMLEFIKQGNLMGEGYGIFLYDRDGIVGK